MKYFLPPKCIFFLLIPFVLSGQIKEPNLSKLSYDELWSLFFEKYKTNSNAIRYAEAYLKKAKNEKYDAQMGRAYYLYAFNYNTKNDVLALSYLEKALIYCKKGKDDYFYSTIYFDKAGILSNNMNFKQAVDNFILAEKTNKDPDFSYILKLNIAVIKSENLGEVDEALSLYKQCYNYYQSKGTRLPQYNGYYQEILFDLADAYKAKKLTDSATYYNKLGYEEAKYSKDEEMLHLFILNEGANQVVEKNYKVALDSIMKALPIMKKHKNNGNTLASYFYLGKVYEGIGKTEKAVKSYKSVDSIYLKYKDIVPEFISGYQYLISYYKSKGDKTNQLKYLSTFMTIDSTIQINYKDVYKTIQKEYEIPNLVKDKEELISSLKGNATYYYWGIGTLLLLVFGVSGLAYYQYYQKKKYRLRFEKIVANDFDKEKPILKENNVVQVKDITDIGINKEIIIQILEKLAQFELDKGFLDSSINVQSLSNQFSTNTKYLSRIVNEYKKKTFIQYVNDLRIDDAIIRLQRDKILRKYSLLALTKEFGFNSPESFSAAFYKKSGIKPLYFINELENENR